MNLLHRKRLVLLMVGKLLALWLIWQTGSLYAQDPVAQDIDEVELVGQVGGFTSALAIQDSYAYLGVGPRLLILDVSIPAQPRLVGQTPVLPGVISDIAINDLRAHLVVDERTLLVIDISDPASPVELGQYSLEVINEIVLVADNEGALHVIDAENPPNLGEIASINVSETNALRMIADSDRVYISDNERSLYIVDISDPGGCLTNAPYVAIPRVRLSL
jgi:hypothetical protein